MDHEVLDFPRMIARLEKLNMEQENHEGDQENKIIEEPHQESENVLIQMKKNLKEHKDV
jgi:hypothetical protein